MSERRDEERELQELIRNGAAVVIVFLLAVIVLAAVVTPYFSERQPDTTLMLGLTASLVGALLALLGVSIVARKMND